MSYALKKGTTSKMLLVYALDATDIRSGRTGLSSRTLDSTAAYIREGSWANIEPEALLKSTANCCLAFISLAFPTRCLQSARRPLR